MVLSGPALSGQREAGVTVSRETARSGPASKSEDESEVGNGGGGSKNMAESLSNAEITEDHIQKILHIHRTSNPPQAPYGQTQVFRHQLYGLRAPLRGER